MSELTDDDMELHQGIYDLPFFTHTIWVHPEEQKDMFNALKRLELAGLVELRPHPAWDDGHVWLATALSK